MATLVELESTSTKSRFVTVAQKTEAGTYAATGADSPLIAIDINHQRNHDGRAFYAYKVYPDSSKLAAGASIDIVIASPSGTYPHVSVDAMCHGDAELYIYEGTSTTGGTTFTPINRNRNYSVSHPSDVAMVINPTVNTLGTELEGKVLAGGEGKKAGGSSEKALELVLKPLTNYLFRLTNVNGTNHSAHLALEWYE